MWLHTNVIRKLLCTACVIGGLFFSGKAVADSGEKANRMVSQPIVVSATRTEKELFEVPSSAAVVGQTKMRREPMKTVAEYLRDIPGVEVSDGAMGGGIKQVKIRGENGSRVLVLIDGMKVSEQKSMNGSMILIDPSNVERIEVIKGPASVLYGSEAIGGVVNVITKKGGTKPVQASLVTTFDTSVDALTPTGALYGQYAGFGYRLSGDYTDAHDKRGAEKQLPDTAYRQQNQSVYLDYAWGTGRVAAGYDRFASRVRVPGADSEGALVQPDLPNWNRERYFIRTEVEQISDYLQKMSLVGFTQRTQKDFTNLITVKRPGMSVQTFLDTENKQRSYGLNFQTDWTFGDSHYVIAGIDYLRDNLEAAEFSRTIARRGAMRPRIMQDNYTNKAHQETLAVFLQDEWNFLEDWTATLGLRQTWVRSALDDTNDSKLKKSKDSDSHLVGSIGLVYSGFDDWRLRASYAQGYKYPVLQQMYIGTVHGGADITYPNADLKPETSQSFELGARYEANGFSGDLAVFYIMSEDYIYRASKTIKGAKSYRFDNGNSARTYGSELTLEYNIAPWHLTPYLSGTYLYKKVDRGSENGGKTALNEDPRWNGRVGARYERDVAENFGIHVDAFARMACRAKEESTRGEVSKTAGWATANLAVGADFGTERQYFVDVNFNNILNKQYTPASSSHEDPGFNGVIRIGVEF